MQPRPDSRAHLVAPAEEGERLDRLLARELSELSRERVKALVLDGRLSIDGAVIADPSYRVKPGERLELELPPPVDATPAAETLPLDILYEDDHLVVLDKAAGMVVHPAPGHAGGTLVNALLAHCGTSLSGIGGVRRPGIVHRLDKDVSGILVVAKHDRAHIGLAAQFTLHSVERVYEAIVFGVPDPAAGRIEGAIGRHPRDRLRMAVVAKGGKPAMTHYRLLAAAGTRAARLEIVLETGRTHQIRVHLGKIGLGIVGDKLYRPRRMPAMDPATRAWIDGLGRIALHARKLAFDHPQSGERLSFERAAPQLFEEISRRLGAEPETSRTRR